jgi:class 3 adenylate cyclase
MQRRLAAILVADVVGYSRLMGADEAGTLASLQERISGIVEPQVAAHAGRIVKSLGDGVLVEFPSAVNAVACAVAMQEAMANANRSLAVPQQILLRIGVNLGDVMAEGADIYGDGVNIAARLEGIADPGGICLSAKVQEEIRGRLDCATEDLGELALKNIAQPVRARIAVLPFTNMSGSPEQDYFADGITEDIITELSRHRDLSVIARNTTFAYKGRALDIKTVARELGADFVVEGRSPGARDHAADRWRNRRARAGGEIRSRDGGHLRGAGRDRDSHRRALYLRARRRCRRAAAARSDNEFDRLRAFPAGARGLAQRRRARRPRPPREGRRDRSRIRASTRLSRFLLFLQPVQPRRRAG